MIQPSGPIYFDKGGLYNHSTVTCFVFDDKGLYILTCGHCIEGAKGKVAYEDKLLMKQVGYEHVVKGIESEQDFGLVSVMNAASLTEENFKIATRNIPLMGVGTYHQSGEAPMFFAGSRSRERLQILRPQLVIGKPCISSPNRFQIRAAGSPELQCVKGDSGTPVYNNGGYLVGMYHMGDGGNEGIGHSGLVIDIHYIFSSLGVKLALWSNRHLWNVSPVKQVQDTGGTVWNVPKW